jgi:hypothetical protein
MAWILRMVEQEPSTGQTIGQGIYLRECSIFCVVHPIDRGILLAAARDTSALGAVQAVRVSKWKKHAAIVGQDCIPEALEEMRLVGSPQIGSVSHEAHAYGPRLIHIGLALLSGQRVAPYNYVEHKLVTASFSARRQPSLKHSCEKTGYSSGFSHLYYSIAL